MKNRGIIPDHFYFFRPWCQAQTQSRWHSVKWEQQFSTNNLRSREAQNWSKETRNNFATEPFTKGFPVFENFCSGVFLSDKNILSPIIPNYDDWFCHIQKYLQKLSWNSKRKFCFIASFEVSEQFVYINFCYSVILF